MRRSQLLFAMTVAMLFGISVFAAFMISIRNARPILEVDNPDDLQLGEVQLQDRSRRTIRFVNTGRRTAEVSELKTSCGCVSVSPKTFAIGPGQSADVELSFDFQSVTDRNEIAMDREFGVNLLAATTPPHRNVFQWRIQARIKSVFKRMPPLVEFQSDGPRSTPIVGRFEVVCHQPLDELQVTPSSSDVRVRVHPDQERRVFQVEFEGAFAEYGEKAVKLAIAPVRSAFRDFPIETQVILRRSPDVHAEPAFINLGMVNPGEAAEATMALVSKSNKHFETKSVSVVSDNAPDATNALKVLPDETFGQFAVAAASTVTGSHSGIVAFDVGQGDEVYTIRVPYNYHVSEISPDTAVRSPN